MTDQPSDRLLPGSGYPPPSPSPAAMPAGEISFRQILGVLRRRYRLVALTAALGAAAGAFLASREPATYQALAVLRVAGERRALTGTMETPTPEVGRTIDPIMSLVQLVRSRSVLGAVVDTLGLQVQSLTPGFGRNDLSRIRVDSTAVLDSIVLIFAPDRVRAQYGVREVSAPYGDVLPLAGVSFAVNGRPSVPMAVLQIRPRETVIDWLLATLVVGGRPETDLIDVMFVSEDRKLAQQIVNYTVNIFQTLNVETAKDKSRRRRVVLEAQLAKTDSTLTKAQADLAGFRSRLQIGSSQNQMTSEQNNLLALDDQRAMMESDRNTFASLLNQLRSGNDAARADALRALASSPALGDNPQVASLYQQLTTYQFKLDSMTTGVWAAAPTNPDLIALRSRIKMTQDQLTSAVSGHVATLDGRINALGERRRRTGQSIQVLPTLVEEESRLASRVQTLNNVGEQLRQDYQRARMAEEVEAGDVEIVDLAEIPYIPLPSATTIKFGLGLTLGLLLGACLAFLFEALNTSIRRPEDIEAMLHLPGLAVIPRLTAGSASSRPRLGQFTKGAKAQLEARPSVASTAGNEAEPFSLGIEAFRMLRTSLIWSDGAEQLRILVVTSAAPGEGKTLTAANLAASFAHDGLRVLLVDCDVRRPKLHGLFRVSRSPGLLDLLAPPTGVDGTVNSLSFGLDGTGDDPLSHVMRPTSIHGLTLLTCGALPTSASNLLSGVRMRSLLAAFKQRFDIVILDTPPVLATADAGILGSLADGVLLVVRAGQTDRSAAQRAYQQLANVGSRVVGAVLNDPKGELTQYGDYYYPYEYTPERQ